MSKIVTANILATGAVVFFGANGAWVASIDQASVFADADAAEVGLALAKLDADKAIIVDPFVTDAGPEKKDGRPAMTLRDTIRAYGPTIKFLPTDPKVA